MDAVERIKRATLFLESVYPLKDGPSPRKIVNISKLIEFDLKLMEEFDDSDISEVFRAFEIAAEQVYGEPTKVRFKGWHKFPSYISLLRDIRASDINKLVTIECDISIFAPPKTSVNSVRWECKSCGEILTFLQLSKEKLFKPKKCVKCESTKFRQLEVVRADIQKLAVREPLENIETNVQNPRQVGVLLRDDMCHKDINELISAGIRIYLTAIVKLEKPDEPESDFLLDAHYIYFIEEDKAIQFTKEEIEEFYLFRDKTDNILDVFSKSFAAHISGESEPKKALLLMIVSGDEKKNKDTKETNQLNILLIGEPGSGKSQLGMQVKEIFPRTRYINAQTTSSVGLTASAIKDEFLGGWQIQAGEIVLAHRGVLIIDDFDGMKPEEQDSLHEAMSLKTIHKSGGNASATLKCETNVLAIANPKYKMWDPNNTISSQITMSKSMINRFDLIYIFKSRTNFIEIEEGLEKIFETFQSKTDETPKIDYGFIKKYLSYAKSLNPSFESGVLEQCKVFFQKIIDKTKKGTIPLTFRQGVSFFKIAKASAKLRLSKQVEKYDAIIAYHVMYNFMKEIAFDEEADTFDMDIIESDTKRSKKSKYHQFYNFIIEMLKEGTVSYDDILIKAIDKLDMDEFEVNRFMETLIEKGDIYYPNPGFVRIMDY